MLLLTSQVAPVVKNPPANAGDTRDNDSVAGLGRSPGGGNGNPPQYSCLKNFMDRGAWWVTVHVNTKSQTRLSMHARACDCYCHSRVGPMTQCTHIHMHTCKPTNILQNIICPSWYFLFFFFGGLGFLVLWPRIEPIPPAVEVWSLNH